MSQLLIALALWLDSSAIEAWATKTVWAYENTDQNPRFNQNVLDRLGSHDACLHLTRFGWDDTPESMKTPCAIVLDGQEY